MLGVTRSTGCTHNLTMRQNIIIIKQHRTPNNYPGCKKLSCAVFQQKDGKQFFLKLVHKRTSWFLVSPKENWEKEIPTTKKQTNKQTENSYHFFPSFTRRLRIPLAVFYLPVTEGPSSPNLPLPTKKSKQHAKPQRQFLLTLCPISPFKTDDFPTFGWPRMRETLVSV